METPPGSVQVLLPRNLPLQAIFERINVFYFLAISLNICMEIQKNRLIKMIFGVPTTYVLAEQ